MSRQTVTLLVLLSAIVVSSHQQKVNPQLEPFPTFDNSIVKVSAVRPDGLVSYGTGFIVTPLGTFLTAAHVIRDESTGVMYSNFRAETKIADSLQIVDVNLVHSFHNDSTGFDLALFQIAKPPVEALPFRHFSIGKPPEKGTQIIIAGFPKVFGEVPKKPIYRTGIVATYFFVNGTLAAILDLTPVKGFSGAPVVDLTGKQPAVFAVVRAFAAGETADLAAADVIPYDLVASALSKHNKERSQTKN